MRRSSGRSTTEALTGWVAGLVILALAPNLCAQAQQNPFSADAGSDQIVDQGATVQLRGIVNSPPANANVTVDWVQIRGPAVSLLGSNTATADGAMADMKAAELRRSELIGTIDLRLVTNGTGGTRRAD